MTDEKFDKSLAAIGHLARLGHILETRLDGRVDEERLDRVIASTHERHERKADELAELRDLDARKDALISKLRADASDAGRRAREEKARADKLELELEKAKADLDDARKAAAPIADAGRDIAEMTGSINDIVNSIFVRQGLLDVPADTPLDEVETGDVPVSLPDDAEDEPEDAGAGDAGGTDEDAGTVEIDGVTYDVVDDATTLEPRPGIPRPVIDEDGNVYASVSAAAGALMPEGKRQKSESIALSKAIRANAAYHGHHVRYLEARA